MSNYTIELRFLENEPISKIFDFNYTYYMKGLVSDEVYNDFLKKTNIFQTLTFINKDYN